MNLLQAGIVDGIVFILTLVLGLAYVMRTSLGKERLFLSLYVLTTYSSYNLMVKPVHDYNLVVPRTFIFHYELFGPLNSVDIIFIFLFFYLLYTYVVKYGFSFPNSGICRAINLIFLRDFFLVLLSLLAFFLFQNFFDYLNISSFKDELRFCRGILYFSVLYLLFCFILRDGSLDFLGFFKRFVVLDVINLVSGYVGTRIYYEYIWERYFLKVSIIDQDDVYTFVVFYFVWTISFLVNFYKTKLPSKYVAVTFAVFVLAFFNFYKTLYMFGVVFFLILLFLRFYYKRRNFVQVCVFVFAVMLMVNSVLYFASSKSIHTRLAQVVDYFDFVVERSPFLVLTGIGHGGYFIAKTPTDDAGEIKKVDLDENEDVKKSLQIPVLTLLKQVGVFGFFVFVLFTFFIFIKILNSIPCYNNFTFALLFSPTIFASLGIMLSTPSPVHIIVFFKMFLLFILYVEHRVFSGEKVASMSLVN